jgi:DNA-binding beta-propeller fold protein YncE
MFKLGLLIVVLQLSAGVSLAADPERHRGSGSIPPSKSFNKQLRPFVSGIDYHTRNLYLFNYRKDALVIVDPLSLPDWPGDVPLQHTVISPDGETLYVTTDNTVDHPAYLIVLEIENINWKRKRARLEVEEVAEFDEPNTPAELPYVTQTNPAQPIPAWLLASGTQIHGPTVLPFTDFIYFTSWTSDLIRVWDSKAEKFARIDPIRIPGYTEQTHGVVFNSSGSLGLGSGYFFDNNVIDLYQVNRRTGRLKPRGKIKLGDRKAYAAFSHYVFWIDERFAVTATMQFDKTSLTPGSTEEVIPPSAWLIDAWEKTATQIISATDHVDGEGIYRSASDLAVVGNKLYFAEEDTLDDTLFEDGFISVFDISDKYRPQFLKRLKPGDGLPVGFTVAHSFTPTPDHRYLMVASWESGYVIKIDTLTDTVVKEFGPKDGLVMPHGLFGAGNIR